MSAACTWPGQESYSPVLPGAAVCLQLGFCEKPLANQAQADPKECFPQVRRSMTKYVAKDALLYEDGYGDSFWVPLEQNVTMVTLTEPLTMAIALELVWQKVW